MRCIPNLVVAAPMDEVELRNMMYTASQVHAGPFSIRYPRGEGSIVNWRQPFSAIPVGRGRKLRDGVDLAILSIGAIGTEAAAAANDLAARGISAAHYDMRFAKPLDEVMLHEVFTKFDAIITLEDGCVTGGFGSAVLEFMGDRGYSAHVKRLGIPDRYIEHGSQKELYSECGYDAAAVVAAAEGLVARVEQAAPRWA
jgi:1-deoxy-D-xylulose-5-phosphate synthase